MREEKDSCVRRVDRAIQLALRREHWYNCIKISVKSDDDLYKIGVVPCAGTWIETVRLKCSSPVDNVVPCAGTWIETPLPAWLIFMLLSRSLRGNVD